MSNISPDIKSQIQEFFCFAFDFVAVLCMFLRTDTQNADLLQRKTKINQTYVLINKTSTQKFF